MTKKRFAALRKVLKTAEVVYVQADGSTVRVADGFFIAWMPYDEYAEHLGDLLPDVTVASRWTRRKGTWTEGGPDLTKLLNDHLKDDQSMRAELMPVEMYVGGMELRKVLLTETSVVILDRDLYKACDDFVDGAVFASERNKPVWFLGDSYGNGEPGAFLLPVNYNGDQFVDVLKRLLGKFPGAISST